MRGPAGHAILDVRLPGISGLDLQDELKRENKYPNSLSHRASRRSNVGQGDEVWRCRVSHQTIQTTGSTQPSLAIADSRSHRPEKQRDLAELRQSEQQIEHSRARGDEPGRSRHA